MKESKNQLKIGMILSYINLAIGNLIPFFYTPIMLNLLGKEEYGLYKLSSSTTSYLSLLAFGIGGAVTRYLIKANVEGGKDSEEKVFGLFNIIYQSIAIITVIIGGVITLNLGFFYSNSLSSSELIRMQIIVGILVINTAVSFSATSFNSVVSSHERFVFIQIMNIISTSMVPVINLVVLFLGYKSIGMVITSLVINVIIRVAYVLYVRNVLHLRPQYKKLPFSLIKEIFVFSFWIFVSDIVGQIYSATDSVIIGMIPSLATVGVAVYSIGYTFPNIIFGISQIAPSILSPRTNKLVFGGATDSELSDFMIKIGRWQAYLVSLISFGFIAFGKPFIDFYAGSDYVDGYWVAVIIMIPNCIPLVQSVAHSIIRAKNKHRFRSLLYVVLAVSNIIATWFLVQYFGIIGAAIPTGAMYLIGNGLIMNWYYWKKINLDIPRFWKNIFPIFISPLMLCVISLIIANYIDFYNMYILLVGIIVFAVLFCLCSWIFVMNEYEKNFIKSPIIKIINKIKLH